jgi:hypothetical protein
MGNAKACRENPNPRWSGKLPGGNGGGGIPTFQVIKIDPLMVPE